MEKEIFSVYFYYSQQEYLLEKKIGKLLKQIKSDDSEAETTVFDVNPSVDEMYACSGAVSFFGGKRVILLKHFKPSSYSDKDIKDIVSLLKDLENSIFIFSCTVEDKKDASGKRFKLIMDTCHELGLSEFLDNPSDSEIQRDLIARAKSLNTVLSQNTARTLMEYCGKDPYLLINEIDKLAALSGYTEIDENMIYQLSCTQLEANVFKLTDYILSCNTAAALRLLDSLILLREEPIKIVGALAGSMTDYYRLKCAAKAGQPQQQVYKAFHYSGSPYRLQIASQKASRISKKSLSRFLLILSDLDRDIKLVPGQELPLMQSAICSMTSLVKSHA